MTEYARVLWLGGGISYEALEAVERACRVEACRHTGPVQTELLNVANAARAEITKRTPVDACDLI